MRIATPTDGYVVVPQGTRVIVACAYGFEAFVLRR